jgi:hypothetical protein
VVTAARDCREGGGEIAEREGERLPFSMAGASSSLARASWL